MQVYKEKKREEKRLRGAGEWGLRGA